MEETADVAYGSVPELLEKLAGDDYNSAGWTNATCVIDLSFGLILSRRVVKYLLTVSS